MKRLACLLITALLIGGAVLSHGQEARRRPIAAASGTFAPTDLSGLQVWFKADTGLTLNTTGYAGTGTISQATTIITGVGTAFLSEVAIGDVLTATGINATVTSISSNTIIEVSGSATGAGGAFTITPQAGTTDRVSAWADQSGNGKNATQATVPNQPIKKASVQNSLPGVLANNNSSLPQVNQRMSTASITNGIGTGDFYIIVAAKRATNNTNAYQAIAAITGSGNASGPYWETASNNHFGIYASGAHAFTGVASAATNYIIELKRISGVWSLRVNGIDDATTVSDSTSVANGTFELFNDDGAGGSASNTYLLEVCFYNSLPSSTNRDNLLTYMNGRWAIY